MVVVVDKISVAVIWRDSGGLDARMAVRIKQEAHFLLMFLGRAQVHVLLSRAPLIVAPH